MKPSEILLLMLHAAGGTIRGKTLVQKRGYFLDLFLDLGLKYRPHYYGPYSAELDMAVGRCKALGLIDQKTVALGYDSGTGFEVRRYDFVLTPDGEKVVEDIIRTKPQQSNDLLTYLEKMSQAGDVGDYVSLSIAAKTYYILQKKNSPMRWGEIVKEARQLGWNINERDIEMAVSFLRKLGLIESSDMESND